MRKLKLSLIANESKRKMTFMTRKRGIMKKLNELTTLCGVQACGVIYSPYLSEEPEVWPSKESIEEVASKLMEMPVETRTKYMRNQETYLRERIAKLKDQVDNLASDNQELEVRQFMFDCLEGKMSDYRYGAKDLHDLHRYINHYIDHVTRRIQILAENGESFSFPPLHVGVADAGTVSAASEFIEHMNMNQTQQKTTQHQMDPVQNQIWNQDMNLALNHNLNFNLDMNSNQYLTQQQSFMGMMREQHMDYAGGHASIPLIDGNHYNYHQQMPSTSTTDVYASYINHNH